MNETPRWLCCWCSFVVLLSTTPAWAQESTGLDVNGDGRADEVGLSRDEEGYRLTVNGEPTAATFPHRRLGSASGEMDELDLGRGRRAVHWRMPLAEEEVAFEALWLVTGRPQDSQLTWHGETGRQGEAGARRGQRLVLEDLTGDGRRDLLVATVAQEVPLCGVAEPELFPRAYDPRRRTWRPVVLNRLRNLTVSPQPLVAERQRPAELGATPMARVAQFVAASTNAGDGGQVQRLTAPRQLDDGDASTVWTEGRPGPGQGEFVTARLIPGDYLVHSLAITLAPAQTEESQPAAIGRLRRFTVLLGSAQGLQRYEVTVPQDPARFPGEPVWLTLPEPTSVRCLSLVLGERWPQTAAEAPTGLAEIAVFTDLDQAGNRDRLSQLLRQTGGGNEALLRALGAAVIPVIEEAWPSLNTVTRRRAVRLLAATNTSRTAPLLAEAALSNDEATARTARQGLRPLGDAAVVALAAQADADNQERAVQIAQLVALMGTNRAASWLVEQVATLALTESRPWDLLVARGLSRADAEVRQDALRRAAEIEGVNQYLLLAGLVPLRDEEVEPFTELVGQAWEGNDSFESRYRLLALAGRMTDHQALSALVRQSLLENDDRYLRARAAEVLASGGPDGEARQWLAEAAHDEWPGVRHAAAQALARRGPGGQVQVMADLLARDPWPVVRAASATALGRPEVTQAESLLVPALLDPSPLVQITVARLLGQGQSETTLVPLTELADDEETSIKVRQAAVGAVGTLCREPAQDTLLRWVQRGLEEGQPVAMRQVAASAATALAPYGADEVLALLTRASNEGVPGMRLAAIEALGQQGRQEARPVLERLAQDSLPPIRAAAASALRMLDRPSENHACPVHSNR